MKTIEDVKNYFKELKNKIARLRLAWIKLSECERGVCTQFDWDALRIAVNAVTGSTTKMDLPTMHKRTAAVTIVMREDEVFRPYALLIKHRLRGWEFAGGKVDYGETVATAAKRELAEETGILPENLLSIKHIGTFETSGFYGLVYLAYLKKEFYEQPIKLEEVVHEGYRWASIAEIGEMLKSGEIFSGVCQRILSETLFPMYSTYLKEKVSG